MPINPVPYGTRLLKCAPIKRITLKTYKELKQGLENRNELNESRLLRKGVAVAYGLRAKNEGKKVEQNLCKKIYLK